MSQQASLIDQIYEPWAGNGTAMATDIGELAVTVNQWRARRSIPPKYWAKIISKAAERGCTIEMSTFIALASPAEADAA